MAIRNMAAGKEVKEAILKQNPTAKIDAMSVCFLFLGSL
jgi:hypothetical protein